MWSLFQGVGACALVAVTIAAGGADARYARADEPGDLLEEAERARRIATEALRREVQVALANVRQPRAVRSTATIDALKRLNDLVLASPDLKAADRHELHEQVTDALRDVNRRAIAEEAAALERLAAATATRDRQNALASITERENRLGQLTDRFNALLDEARYDLAENVAAVAEAASADAARTTASLRLNAGLKRNAHNAAMTRVDRQKGVVDTLYRSEVAHVPQSDEPPIVYIDAAEWQELTLRRGKYSTDMYQESPADARIRKALDEATDLDFVETPLGDAVLFLKDRHGIEIQLDVRALDEIGSSSDVPVTIQARGITLRSALRLLLKQLDLTYVVQDEVLLITTPEKAAAILVPHVYRVGDVVVPIKNFEFSGGFGQLGGGNNNGMFGVGQNQNGANQQNQNNVNPFNNQNANPFGQNAKNNFF